MDFNTLFDKIKDKSPLVVIPEKRIERAKLFVEKVIEAKKIEKHHIIDDNQIYKRFYTGVLGELAIEQILKRKFINWAIGDSINFHTADLSKFGFNVGIKTVEEGKFPIIFKKSNYPEIINIKKSDNEVYVCGIASSNILNTYQDDKFILDNQLLERGTKTAFVGLDKLEQFSTVEEFLFKYKNILLNEYTN
jgi:hypothetical protein